MSSVSFWKKLIWGQFPNRSTSANSMKDHDPGRQSVRTYSTSKTSSRLEGTQLKQRMLYNSAQAKNKNKT